MFPLEKTHDDGVRRQLKTLG